jgi:hypothetical protein
MIRNVTLQLDDFPRLSHVAVFAARGLSRGSHTLKLVNRSSSAISLEGFRVYP